MPGTREGLSRSRDWWFGRSSIWPSPLRGPSQHPCQSLMGSPSTSACPGPHAHHPAPREGPLGEEGAARADGVGLGASPVKVTRGAGKSLLLGKPLPSAWQALHLGGRGGHARETLRGEGEGQLPAWLGNVPDKLDLGRVLLPALLSQPPRPCCPNSCPPAMWAPSHTQLHLYPTGLLTGCVALGRLLHFSEPQWHHLENGLMPGLALAGVWVQNQPPRPYCGMLWRQMQVTAGSLCPRSRPASQASGPLFYRWDNGGMGLAISPWKL